MLQLKDLDGMIARLDRALARAMVQGNDPLAVHELAYCLQAFARIPIPPTLPADVSGLALQVMRVARRLTPTEPDNLRQFREILLDIAAAIAVQPWDQWASATVTENGVICPLYD
jgi:hypothetical protein